MAGTNTLKKQFPSINPSTSGIIAILIGLVFILLYPLSIAGILPGARYMPPGIPRPSHPLVVYISQITGPILLTWGYFTYRHCTYTPLTPRRALSALLPAAAGIAMGVGYFTHLWEGTPPVNIEGNSNLLLDLIDIIRLELTAVQFVSFAAVSALFVGTVYAINNLQKTIVSGALPIGIVILGYIWGPQNLTPGSLLVITVLIAIPFVVGFEVAQTESFGLRSEDP